MKACVLTVDQHSSRAGTDLVPDAVTQYGAGALLGFERTAGDEIQALFVDPGAVATTLADLIRSDAWHIGIGIGAVDEPLPDSARAGRGTAYVHARSAVTRAKNAPGRISVVTDSDYGERLETVLWLWAALLARRTRGGWEVADLVAEGLTHTQVAERLGVSQSAVSQRGRAAGLVEDQRARSLVTDLIGEALADPAR
ncbi:transposase [Nocardioides sp. AE5]|uniref:transposase n=1 Tax=Nocardioides sp. AE5 TaxID=2962573 RepID=UPI0028812C64|nr:transposase [Nocardioides sp. AE5]MDT0201147.1 transposase [Nocardioides sp. AE5]